MAEEFLLYYSLYDVGGPEHQWPLFSYVVRAWEFAIPESTNAGAYHINLPPEERNPSLFNKFHGSEAGVNKLLNSHRGKQP